MNERPSLSVDQLIIAAANEVCAMRSDVDPWVYGWCTEEYRHSDIAALPGTQGPVGIGGAGVQAYEEAVNRLLKEPAIKERWDDKELWGMIATLVVAVSESTDPEPVLAAALGRLREARPSIVVLPVANVSWESDPIEVGTGLIGRLNDEFVAAIARSAMGRSDLSSPEAQEWIRDQLTEAADGESVIPPREPVVAALWTNRQHTRSIEVAERWLEDLCCLALLLERDPSGKGMWSMRGAHNRPGVRGLVPDRSTLQDVLGRDARGRHELGSEPFVSSPEFGASRSVRWYSADPVPLDELLDEPAVVALIGEAATGTRAVLNRLRVAARWYSGAHWSYEPDDAALFLGVALDAIVGSRDGLPGRVMAQRFAYLHPDPSQRRATVARYNDVYSVRSAVAHGGQPSRLSEPGFIRSFADDVRWAAERLVALGSSFGARSEADVDAAFQALALGEKTW